MGVLMAMHGSTGSSWKRLSGEVEVFDRSLERLNKKQVAMFTLSI